MARNATSCQRSPRKVDHDLLTSTEAGCPQRARPAAGPGRQVVGASIRAHCRPLDRRNRRQHGSVRVHARRIADRRSMMSHGSSRRTVQPKWNTEVASRSSACTGASSTTSSEHGFRSRGGPSGLGRPPDGLREFQTEHRINHVSAELEHLDSPDHNGHDDRHHRHDGPHRDRRRGLRHLPTRLRRPGSDRRRSGWQVDGSSIGPVDRQPVVFGSRSANRPASAQE